MTLVGVTVMIAAVADEARSAGASPVFLSWGWTLQQLESDVNDAIDVEECKPSEAAHHQHAWVKTTQAHQNRSGSTMFEAATAMQSPIARIYYISHNQTLPVLFGLALFVLGREKEAPTRAV